MGAAIAVPMLGFAGASAAGATGLAMACWTATAAGIAVTAAQSSSGSTTYQVTTQTGQQESVVVVKVAEPPPKFVPASEAPACPGHQWIADSATVDFKDGSGAVARTAQMVRVCQRCGIYSEA